MKKSISDLAIFGGQPLFDKRLHVGQPNIGNREHFLGQVNDILDRHWLTNDGPYVQELERNLADLLGVKHCLTVCNGTIGLQLLAAATGLKGEVILPSFTFIASAHALQWQGLRPVFCDIQADTHNIDPSKIEALITENTSAIMGVHLWGQACDVEALQALAERYKLRLLFDAAHAFMCSAKGQFIGNFGDAEVFSFHATKFFNTLEGGAVATNDDKIAQQIRLLRNFGFGGTAYDAILGLGLNAKMNEISAAMGLSNLASAQDFIQVNLSHHQQYLEQLSGLNGLRLLAYDSGEANNYQYVIGEVDEQAFELHRDMLLAILHAENILARRYFYPGCHKVEPYLSLNPELENRLPVTERLTSSVFALPTGTALSAAEIEKISALIRFSTQHAAAIKSRWPD